MTPIRFACTELLPLPPEAIAQQILDLAKWPDFTGYGPIPGIKAAEFEVQTPGVVGTRIRVLNLDGSSHVEEVIDWRPGERVQLRMGEFSAPVSRLATSFLEAWDFTRCGNETRVTRSLELHPKSMATKPVLWVISFFLQRAIVRHLRQLRNLA